MLKARALLSGLALGSTLLVSSGAQGAAPPAERWQELPFVYVSPGLLAVPMAETGTGDLDATWQWSAGGGMMLIPRDSLYIQVGGVFEHMILNFDGNLVRGHQFRIMPEARIGWGNDRLFVYGLAGIGLGLNHVKTDILGTIDTRTDGGFNMQLGAGALYMIWDSLAIGGELDADLGFYRLSNCDACGERGYETYILGIKVLASYQF